MNYHEASIFLEEGENNEKFDSHPHNPAALPAYLLVHNRWYYGLDMATSIVLLVLAFVEDPAIPYFKVPVAAASSVELLALSVITIELAMKLRWIGWRTILKHKRTMLKGLTLGIMFMEAITVLIRQSSHFRVTRALRPIFLVDTRHCGPVRRFIRQIFQSLPPILDMMGLLLFFICIYSLLGFYLFSSYKHTHHFDTLQDSFVSMFVLLTTANFPDVMMPLYSKSKWYSIFFISYLCIVLYVLMNLMLAVVYETFTRIERDKFRKLLLHKRKACQHAFRLLVSKQNPNKVRFKQFEGLMRYYAPKKSLLDTVLMFKELNVSGSGSLSLEEFYSVYDAALLRWEPQFSHIPWFHTTWPPLQKLCQLAHDAVNWQYFEPCVYVITLCNGVAMVIRLFNESSNLEEAAVAFCASWDTFTFIGLYAVEAMLRVMGFGVGRYFKSGWNVYDFLVNVAALLGAVVLYIVPSFVYVVVFRPLRLLRLFKLKKRYRDVFGTLVLLTPLMCSTAIVMLVLYYFFAIVGMELFAGYDMKNCCSVDNSPWEPTTTSRICSVHFIGNKRSGHPKNPAFVPSLFPKNYKKTAASSQASERYERSAKRLKKSSYVDIIDYECSTSAAIKKHEVAIQTDVNETIVCDFVFFCTTDGDELSTQASIPLQVCLNSYKKRYDKSSGTSDMCNEIQGFQGYPSIRDETEMRDLTGVTFAVFNLLLTLLLNQTQSYSKISKENRLLIFLMKMKTGLSYSAMRVQLYHVFSPLL
ncbi:two pore calcium channel protein 1-like isoform X3 [Bacillus rossius redtenbacheri]